MYLIRRKNTWNSYSVCKNFAYSNSYGLFKFFQNLITMINAILLSFYKLLVLGNLSGSFSKPATSLHECLIRRFLNTKKIKNNLQCICLAKLRSGLLKGNIRNWYYKFQALRNFRKTNPCHPDLRRREKINLHFCFHTSLWSP